jgi:hypothetical protein
MPQSVSQQPWQEHALLGQLLLIYHSEDSNNMCKVFLVAPMGINGYAEVGCIRKLDVEDLGFFLGRDDVYHQEVRNGWGMRQLPLLALSVLQRVRRLEGGTYFWHDARIRDLAGVS